MPEVLPESVDAFYEHALGLARATYLGSMRAEGVDPRGHVVVVLDLRVEAAFELAVTARLALTDATEHTARSELGMAMVASEQKQEVPSVATVLPAAMLLVHLTAAGIAPAAETWTEWEATCVDRVAVIILGFRPPVLETVPIDEGARVRFSGKVVDTPDDQSREQLEAAARFVERVPPPANVPFGDLAIVVIRHQHAVARTIAVRLQMALRHTDEATAERDVHAQSEKAGERRLVGWYPLAVVLGVLASSNVPRATLDVWRERLPAGAVRVAAIDDRGVAVTAIRVGPAR